MTIVAALSTRETVNNSMAIWILDHNPRIGILPYLLVYSGVKKNGVRAYKLIIYYQHILNVLERQQRIADAEAQMGLDSSSGVVRRRGSRRGSHAGSRPGSRAVSSTRSSPGLSPTKDPGSSRASR